MYFCELFYNAEMHVANLKWFYFIAKSYQIKFFRHTKNYIFFKTIKFFPGIEKIKRTFCTFPTAVCNIPTASDVSLIEIKGFICVQTKNLPSYHDKCIVLLWYYNYVLQLNKLNHYGHCWFDTVTYSRKVL